MGEDACWLIIALIEMKRFGEALTATTIILNISGNGAMPRRQAFIARPAIAEIRHALCCSNGNGKNEDLPHHLYAILWHYHVLYLSVYNISCRREQLDGRKVKKYGLIVEIHRYFISLMPIVWNERLEVYDDSENNHEYSWRLYSFAPISATMLLKFRRVTLRWWYDAAF